MLPNIKYLDEFSLEAASELDGEKGPRWDYLYDSTICSLILGLPPCLNNLTIDMCGSGVVTRDRGRDVVHLCPVIGDRLCDFQNVRLRLRCICPRILQPLSKPKPESRLKTLFIKLNLPYFSDVYPEFWDRLKASPCDRSEIPLDKRMVTAGRGFTENIPGLTRMRISFRDGRRNRRVRVADCSRERYVFERSKLFEPDDGGSFWLEWESSEYMQDSGCFRDLLYWHKG